MATVIFNPSRQGIRIAYNQSLSYNFSLYNQSNYPYLLVSEVSGVALPIFIFTGTQEFGGNTQPLFRENKIPIQDHWSTKPSGLDGFAFGPLLNR